MKKITLLVIHESHHHAMIKDLENMCNSIKFSSNYFFKYHL